MDIRDLFAVARWAQASQRYGVFNTVLCILLHRMQFNETTWYWAKTTKDACPDVAQVAFHIFYPEGHVSLLTKDSGNKESVRQGILFALSSVDDLGGYVLFPPNSLEGGVVGNLFFKAMQEEQVYPRSKIPAYKEQHTLPEEKRIHEYADSVARSHLEYWMRFSDPGMAEMLLAKEKQQAVLMVLLGYT